MLTKRCFLCGAKMLENGLCFNPECIRSVPVSGTTIAKEMEAAEAQKTAETLTESGK